MAVLRIVLVMWWMSSILTLALLDWHFWDGKVLAKSIRRSKSRSV